LTSYTSLKIAPPDRVAWPPIIKGIKQISTKELKSGIIQTYRVLEFISAAWEIR